MTLNEERKRANTRKVDIFKYMIQFLEIFGNENYGQSAEVNWGTVWNYCSQCDLLDFNTEIEDLVYHTEDDKFRDEVFKFIEKQAVEGYPMWRLFTMSEWLSNKCEEELHNIEHQKDIDFFNKTRCYRCKHFQCQLRIMYSTLLEPISVVHVDCLDKFKKNYANSGIKNISHIMSCKKREEILEEAFKEHCKGKDYISHHEEEYFKEFYNFKYKKFKCDDESQNWEGYKPRGTWVLTPSALKRCPYFEESDMTVEQFEKLWYEIPRI